MKKPIPKTPNKRSANAKALEAPRFRPKRIEDKRRKAEEKEGRREAAFRFPEVNEQTNIWAKINPHAPSSGEVFHLHA